MKRHGRIHKGLLFLLFVFAVLVGLFFSLRYYLTSSHASQQIADKLQDVLGVPVQVDEADVGLQSGSTIGRVKVFEDEGQRPEVPWLIVQHVSTDLTALDVLRGNATPKQVTLTGAAINLRFAADGQLMTKLPSIKGTGGAFPQLILKQSRLTLDQAGRQPMVVEGVEATANDESGALAFHGTIHDPYWGDWTVEGAYQPAEGQVRCRLKNPRLAFDQAMCDRLPFVSKNTFEQVKTSGVAAVDFDLGLNLSDKNVHYRIDLVSEDSKVAVTSIDLQAEHVKGKVRIEDRFVELRELSGKTADGDIQLSKSDLDFRQPVYVMTFDVSVKQVELRKLPATWKIPTPLQGPLPLTGKADLRVEIAAGKVHTTGEGRGSVEAIIARQPTTIEIRLHANESGFHFSVPAKGVFNFLKMLPAPIMLQPPPPEPVPAGPHPLEKPIGALSQSAQAATNGIFTAGTRAMKQVQRWTGSQTIKKTEYLEANFGLKNVDLQELLDQSKVTPPFALSGKVSFQVQLGIPIDTPNEMRAYKLHGSATSAALTAAGLALTELAAKVRYEDGLLTLDELRGQFADSGGAFDGSGQLQLIPQGDLTLKLHVERVPLDRVLALLPGADATAAGTISGELTARVPAKLVRDPLAWKASGTLRSERLSAYGLSLTKPSLALTVTDGLATAHDLAGQLEGGSVSGNAELRWADGYPFQGQLDLHDVDLAALEHLSPNLRAAVAFGGRASLKAAFQGKLTPLTFTASGAAETVNLSVAGIPLGTLGFEWNQTSDRIQLSEVTTKLYDGTASGSAIIPLKETVPGSLQLKLDAIEVQQLTKAAALVPVTLSGRISGTIDGTLSAAAPGKPRTLNTEIALTAPKLRVQGLATQNVQGRLTYRAGGADYHLEGEALGGRLDLTGVIPPLPEANPPQGHLRIEGMRLSRLGEALNLREPLAPLTGRVELDLPFHHEGPERLPVGAGRFRVSNVRWAGNELAENIQGEVRLTGRDVQFREVSGNFGEGALRATLVLNLQEPERSHFNVQLERVDASRLLLPLLPTSANSPTSQPVGATAVSIEGPLDLQLRGHLGREWQATGSVALSRGKVYGIDVGEFRLPLSISYNPAQGSGQLEVSDNSAQLARGRAQGRASVRWGAGEGLRLEGALRFFDVDLPTLLRSTGEANRLSGGRASGRLLFNGDNVRSLDDLSATLDASFAQAQALQLPVLDVLSRFVAPGQSAMTFQQGDLHATLGHGVIRVKRLSLANSTLQMIVEGNVTVQGRLDLDATANTGGLPLPGGLRVPAVGQIPLATLTQATALLSNRIVRLRISGTLKNPNVQIDTARLLTDEALRFFLGAAVGIPAF